MAETLDRLKILLDSSTPIVETVEEMRAVRLVGAGELVPEVARASTGGYAGTAHDPGEAGSQAIYNSREPAQALGNLEAMSLEAAFILKDFHRHMDDPVVVRRLRDVGQKFSANRRTVILTAPSITIPPELGSLVEFLELPLPDKQRLRQIIDEMIVRVGKTRHVSGDCDPVWSHAGDGH
jgi:hypothetical protein